MSLTLMACIAKVGEVRALPLSLEERLITET